MICVAPAACGEDNCLLAPQKCLLRAPAGLGTTRVLRYLQVKLNADYLDTRSFMDRLKQRMPAALEETFAELLEEILRVSDVVFVDDFHLITQVTQGYEYPRTNLMNAALSMADEKKKRLLFAVGNGDEPPSVRDRALAWRLSGFDSDDFETICRNYLGESVSRIDFSKIYRAAPALTGYQLKNACLWLGLRDAEPDTEGFLEYLSVRGIASATSTWKK